MRIKKTKISLLLAVLIQMNAMVGAGVLSIPIFIIPEAGAGGVISCLLGMGIALSIALSLGRLSILHPGSGWSYRFPALWGGHRLGVVSSWLYIVGVIVAMGFVAQQGGVWLHAWIPGLQPQALSILALIVLTLLVLVGGEVASVGQYIISAVVVLALGTTIVVCFGRFELHRFSPILSKGMEPILSVVPKLLFSFLGLESISSLYGSIKNPRKNVFLGGVISVLFVGMLYLLFFGSIAGAIPSSEISGAALPSLLMRTFPQYRFTYQLILFGGLFAILGTLYSMIWSVGQLLQSLVEKRAHLGKRRSIVITAFLMMGVALLIDGEKILLITVIAIATSYVLSISALLFEKDEWRSGRNIIPCIGLIGGVAMIVYSLYSL